MDEKEYADPGEQELTSEDSENAAAAENSYIKMDFSLATPEERNEKVKEIIAATPSERLTPKYLEKLADYIIFAMDKQERKNGNILTDNRMVTVNKRETSFEGLVGKMENGEDGIYNIIANDKNIIFQPKISITEEDIETIPGMKALVDSIKKLEEKLKTVRGKKAYYLKKNIIDMRKDQYQLKNIFKKPIYCANLIKSVSKLDLSEEVFLDEEGNVKSTGIVNLFNEKHVSALLCNYSKIKEDSWEKVNSDSKWIIFDLENLIEKNIKNQYPIFYDIIIYKIDGVQNAEIQKLILEKYGIKHSVEYISSLWRNKIPKLIADAAQAEWLDWHFLQEEKGTYKRCSRCGQIKIAHNRYFSKNKTSKDGFYSICKECRNKK